MDEPIPALLKVLEQVDPIPALSKALGQVILHTEIERPVLAKALGQVILIPL